MTTTSKSEEKGLRMALLGGAEVTFNGQPMSNLSSRKALALLFYLAVTNRPHTRSALAGLLWPDVPEENARMNLRKELARIRRAAGPYLLATRHEITFNRQLPCRMDVEDFERLSRSQAEQNSDDLAEAVVLYKGEFLQGFSILKAPPFEEWLAAARARLRELALQARYRLAVYYSHQGLVNQAITHLQALVTLEPYHEEAHRQLMQLYVRAGQRGAALAQYQTCRDLLVDELSIEPSAETRRLYERIRSVSSTGQRHNLPSQTSPFIGRQEEISRIYRLLAKPECRLLTIIGPGGVGKTRLAVQVADRVKETFLNGTFFVSLAARSSEEGLVKAVAGALGFDFSGSDPPTVQLNRFLREKHVLLLLDNFEHLRQTTPFILTTLRHAPEVKFLITSRARLGLTEEWLFELGGLPWPGQDQDGETHSWEGPRLFLQSAGRLQSKLSYENARSRADIAAVNRICRLVEGLPLAIELAATWTRIIPITEIAAELEKSLSLLIDEPLHQGRDVEKIDRTGIYGSMQAVLDRSWLLLSTAEQVTFSRLSVFQGGFTRRAAAVVAKANLPVLRGLVDNSLIRLSADGRYDLHELTRQYAEVRLAGDPDRWQETMDAHADYYYAFLKAREEGLQTTGAPGDLDRIEVEIENIRLAWKRLLDRRSLEAISGSLQALYLVFELRGWYTEGLEIMRESRRILEKGRPEPGLALLIARLIIRQAAFCERLSQYEQADRLLDKSLGGLPDAGAGAEMDQERALALTISGSVRWRQGRFHSAEVILKESLDASGGIHEASMAESEPAPLTGFARYVRLLTTSILGDVYRQLGQYEPARRYFESGLSLAELLDNQRFIATFYHSLGIVAYETGRYDLSLTYHRRSLSIRRQLRDRWGEAASLNSLGNVTSDQGLNEDAKDYYRQSLAVSRELGNRQLEASTLNNLGTIAYTSQNYIEARSFYQESLEICRDIGDRRGEAIALMNLGEVAMEMDNHKVAQTSLEESLAVFELLGYSMGVIVACNYLGNVYSRLNNQAEAEDFYDRALAKAWKIGAEPRMLESLLGKARLRAQAGEQETAAGWLALIQRHPATERPTAENAGRLLEELERDGFPYSQQTAELNLMQVVREIMVYNQSQ